MTAFVLDPVCQLHGAAARRQGSYSTLETTRGTHCVSQRWPLQFGSAETVARAFWTPSRSLQGFIIAYAQPAAGTPTR